MADSHGSHVIYRAVLLAAALLVLGLVFRQLVTLLLAVLVTVIIAIPLAAAADKLEARGIPRQVGALAALLSGLLAVAAVIAILIPPFVDQTNEFVDKVPALFENLREQTSHVTGAEPNELGHRVQDFFQRYTDDPTRLIGPVTAIGINVAGVLGAFILILITSYYMAIRPRPLIDGVQRLWPPPRRAHVAHVMSRLREAWIGWMFGVGIDMLVQGVLVYVGLTLVGLDYAVFFAVLSSLLVFIPYFGAIAGGIPPLLLALTDSPGKAALVFAVYVLVQQIEGNLIIPLVMARTIRSHPALIAIGVVVVGQLFGFVGLFLAVPIISLIQIGVEEFWVKPLEDSYRRREADELALRELDDGDDHPREDEYDDHDLHRDPEPG
jgi:predicted PurR-regulated permease PerM